MNPYERRRIMKGLVDGTISGNELSRLSAESSHEEVYGERKDLAKAGTAGRRIETNFNGENRTYWVPREGAWVSGKGITLEEAYRIFSEDNDVMNVGEVRNEGERQAIIRGYQAEIRRVLDKRTD